MRKNSAEALLCAPVPVVPVVGLVSVLDLPASAGVAGAGGAGIGVERFMVAGAGVEAVFGRKEASTTGGLVGRPSAERVRG